MTMRKPSQKTVWVISGVVVALAILGGLAYVIFGRSQTPQDTQQPAPITAPQEQPQSEDETQESQADDESAKAVSEVRAALDDHSIVKADSDTLSGDTEHIDAATKLVSEGIDAYAALPLTRDPSAEASAVTNQFWYGYPSTALSVYNVVADNNGHLTEGSLKLFEYDNTASGTYKVFFTVTDASGNVALSCDGYYDANVNQVKIADVAYAAGWMREGFGD